MIKITINSIDYRKREKAIEVICKYTDLEESVVAQGFQRLPFSIEINNTHTVSTIEKELKDAGCSITSEIESTNIVSGIGQQEGIFKTSLYNDIYNILGEKVSFELSAQRYFDLTRYIWHAMEEIRANMQDWYLNQKKIENVLSGYKDYCLNIFAKVANPLFDNIKTCDILDISKETYFKQCISSSNSASALDRVCDEYDAIQEKLEDEIGAREYRKATRDRWSGGGFGMSGAIKGAMKAGMLNAASGIGHSMVNAVGNAGSAIAAASSRSALYNDTSVRDVLLQGILEDIRCLLENHMIFLNLYNDGYVKPSFDTNKAKALLANAKDMPEKRVELLVRAFKNGPWNGELLSYIFINFPESRKDVVRAAARFEVDMTDSYESIIKKEYSSIPGRVQNEEHLIETKARIKTIMDEYNISQSATLDLLDLDYLAVIFGSRKKDTIDDCNALLREVELYDTREELKSKTISEISKVKDSIWENALESLCTGFNIADEKECNEMIEKIRAYDAPSEKKEKYYQRIKLRIEKIWTDALDSICAGYESADENTCNVILSNIKSYHSPEDFKTEHYKKIQKRIEDIWSAEDGEIFDNVYLGTNLHDPISINKAKEFITQKKRTDAADPYLQALGYSNEKNINKARRYNNKRLQKILTIIIIVLAIVGVLTFSIGVGVVCIIADVPIIVWKLMDKKSWNILTLDGKYIHPVIEESSQITNDYIIINQVVDQVVSHVADTVSDQSMTWTCSCGQINNGSFCTACGSKHTYSQMLSQESVDEKKDNDDSEWICTCGRKNTGNFCPECGTTKMNANV